MQNFQTYYPTQMPILSSSYSQPMINQPNPYMDRLSQLQSMQQNMASQQSFLPLGKIAESVETVKATDIPIDGNAYYFPKADGSAIYTKRWLPNGTTEIMTYAPVIDTEPKNTTNEAENFKIALLDDLTDVVTQKFEEVFEKLDKVEKALKPTKAVKEA